MILLGIVIMILGICIIVWSSTLTEIGGRRARADRHLGGTTKGYVLIGFGIIVMSVFIMFDKGGTATINENPTGFGTVQQ